MGEGGEGGAGLSDPRRHGVVLAKLLEIVGAEGAAAVVVSQALARGSGFAAMSDEPARG
jgi:hypothetical protein